MSSTESRTTARFPATTIRKGAAVAAGRADAILRQTEHVIHNQDGSFGERDSYGSAPQRSKG